MLVVSVSLEALSQDAPTTRLLTVASGIQQLQLHLK